MNTPDYLLGRLESWQETYLQRVCQNEGQKENKRVDMNAMRAKVKELMVEVSK